MKQISASSLRALIRLDIRSRFGTRKDVSKKEKTQEFTRKRKGKGYVVDIKKKQSYKELEDDLRSLYDTVTDVVEDFDGTATPDVIETPKKKKISIFGKRVKTPSKRQVLLKKQKL